MDLFELDTPCLTIDLDILERNIKRMGDYCKEKNISLRPHIKTHKIPEIAKMQIASGAVGITSAKVTEAEVMVNAGLKNVMIAYPVFGEEKLNHLMQLTEKADISISLNF